MTQQRTNAPAPQRPQKTALPEGFAEGEIREITIPPAGGQPVYTVLVSDTQELRQFCRAGVDMFSSLLGFKMSKRLEVGTGVMLVGNWIVFCLPRAAKMQAGKNEKQPGVVDDAREMPDPETPEDEAPSFADPWPDGSPAGMLEGEFQIMNLLQVGVQFLTTMMRLKAGDRALIECHLTRDLVRMVSGMYRHHSAAFDHEIFSKGGRNNEIREGSQYEHEMFGAENDDDAKLKTDNSTMKIGDVEADAPIRARWAIYQGHLGDLVHFFVQDPGKVMEDMVGPPVGKFHAHIGQDGKLIVQSVSDIVFERVVRIRVPVRKKQHDQDGATSAETIAKDLEKKYLKLSKLLKATNSNVPGLIFQLREYSRWLSEYHSYARFLQTPDDYDLDGERTEKPNYDNREQDRVGQSTSDAVDVYATIRINRDGSVGAQEAGGAAITLSRGQFVLSGTQGGTIESAGDLDIRAGGELRLMGRRRVEIVSLVGDIAFVCRTAFRALCQWGPIHLRTDADPDARKTLADQPETTDPDPEKAWPKDMPAVVLESSNGEAAILTKKDIMLQSKEGGMRLRGKLQLHLTGFEEVVIHRLQKLTASIETLQMTSSKVLMRVFQLLDINSRFRLEAKGIFVDAPMRFVRALFVQGALFAPKVGPIPPGPNAPGVKLHYGHVRVIDDVQDQIPVSDFAGQDVAPATTQESAKVLREALVRWRLRSDAAPAWNQAISGAEPQSLSQAFVEQARDADIPSFADNFLDLNPADFVLQGDRIDGDQKSKLPHWAGRERQQVLETGMDEIFKDQTGPTAEIGDKATGEIKTRQTKFHWRKPSS